MLYGLRACFVRRARQFGFVCVCVAWVIESSSETIARAKSPDKRTTRRVVHSGGGSVNCFPRDYPETTCELIAWRRKILQ